MKIVLLFVKMLEFFVKFFVNIIYWNFYNNFISGGNYVYFGDIEIEVNRGFIVGVDLRS